ncbi:MAG TPA: pyrroline-5-carboxylate reductase [Rectinemataceae bacterium]|nr:pyrroline-5-carboxylate reductase [Rectinemataceae bacterium]
MKRRIGFIGAGRIVEVMLKAIGPTVGYGNISVWNRTRSRAEKLAAEFGIAVADTVAELAEGSDWLLLAVKPHAVAEVLQAVAPHVREDCLLVSMAAGVRTDKIKGYFPKPPRIVRIMPNLPMSVGIGMTAVCADAAVPAELVEEVRSLFAVAGRASLVEERLFDTVTALSGSGPAFAFLFIESLADGAVLNGMGRELAYEFAAQTVLGAARIILDSDKHPGELKDIVASPAGTTMAGIHSLERNAFRSIVMDAVDAAAKRSRELAH